jgi:pyridoxal phosphate enzyme (YggS family)
VAVDPARIRDNLDRVRTRMESACRRVGRDPREVTLVAVTKTVGLDEVRTLASLAVRNFGENRVDDLVRKTTALAELDLRWHMIGHLQRNKARKLLPHSTIIHSLESTDLAAELGRRAGAADLTVDVLIEVNVAGEEQKYGVPPDDAPALAEIVADTPALNLRGLMTMAPLADDPEATRPVFARLRELSGTLAKDLSPGSMRHLSMGMTQDFEVAIEEGATLVRVGSALFK